MLIAKTLFLARFRLANLPFADRTSSSPPKLAQRARDTRPSPAPRFPRGEQHMSLTKTPVTLCCVTILAVAIPLSLRMTKAAATAATPSPEPIQQAPEGGGAGGGASQSVSLGVVMHRTGLTPEALAAAGLGEASTMSVGGAAQLANAGLVTSLRDLDHAVGQARNARDAAERKIQSGK
ncbi:MAG: hypothetical protein HUU28_15535, partial [Planctomycetaceae bacterium]|nr:hypothetical protein [Planctomycetaceae bacterium]